MSRSAIRIPGIVCCVLLACGSRTVPILPDAGPDAVPDADITQSDVAPDTPVDLPSDPIEDAGDGIQPDTPPDPGTDPVVEVGGETGDPGDPGSPDTNDDTDVAFQCQDMDDCTADLGEAPLCSMWACLDGACVPAALDDGTPCDDENPCTDNDHCQDGQCLGGPVLCPVDENPCVAEACDPEQGCLLVPVTGTACDDEDACTDNDQCILGDCRGQPLDCDDGDPCTLDGCASYSGCVHTAASGPSCDDGNACTQDDLCTEGTCNGTTVDCDDGNPCTGDDCEPDAGCVHSPLYGLPCDDLTACTDDDHCQEGHCAGTPLDCDDGNPCTSDTCDAASGCQHGPANGVPCNDGNACTDEDQCLDGLCMGQASDCDDGNPCTLDTCSVQGGCLHTEPPGFPCDDGNACTVEDKCYQGTCLPGLPLDCDDGDECTSDSCDPATGCVQDLLTGTPCDDGNACTDDDLCTSGLCQGWVIPCLDGQPCTSDGCDPAVGCVFTPIDAGCDDGDPCTSGDYCQDGVCHPGEDPDCLEVERVVLAGDSWSAGLIGPLRDALDDRGYEEVVVTWELTAKPGSTVAGWLADPNLMAGLFVSLDADPPAEMLIFTLSGNDYLGACKSGLGLVGPLEWWMVMTKIQWDLQNFVNLARAGRPHLKVVLVGYDYLNYFVLDVAGITFPGFDFLKFNLGLVDLGTRGRDVATATPDMIYAHNMGILQYSFGDSMFGYGPGVVPKPGPAPAYEPFPGGWYTHPSPFAYIPDGIHPNYDGMRAIIENSLDQGPADWIEGN